MKADNAPRMLAMAVLVILAGLYYYTDKQQSHYEQTVLPQTKSMLETITQWDKFTLVQQLSPQARQTISDQQLEQLLANYSRLGELRSIGALEFSRVMSALSLFSAEKRVSYSGTLQFDNGDANLTLTLIENNQQWFIYNFSLSSKLLTQ